MRNNFIHKLTELAAQDERIVLLTADLGFSVLEGFAEKFPDRFYNVGVSEQNMLGVATGLAEAGLIPFTYSIAPFSVLRPYEFIKNGPVLHNLPVRIVAIGPGFEYGNLGATHHLIEDVAATRLFPNLMSLTPINTQTAEALLEETYTAPHPVYYRIGKNATSLSDDMPYTQSSHFIELSQGKDICIVSLGSMTEEAIKACNILLEKDVSVTLLALKRIDSDLPKAIEATIKPYKKVLTVEAQYINGGVGSAIAEVIAENSLPIRLKRLGVSSLSDGVFGGASFMAKKHGMSAEDIAKAALDDIR